ncbi:NADH-quinone oxidoreductase subunit N [Buchnera aphidicola]|uniref:NADH-quinone oxidoreductase subunit N n=1 Tax=Buchnera aphidicola (Sarucallis kahawaluokalani) TaxID=1241878 RepID=A0A4D6YHU7_9GAMM|nr:NADH-quinone oxidoreductase subunit N [Buchnera aphidicola]QCI25921.1 NADH-quinone oxidoreductase subunit N [Buchnera aphidicola (Sarucallis kahawaluokalani)]
MFIPIFKLVALLPLVILMTGIIVIMFSMIFRRNHFFVFCVTFLSLFSVLCILFLIYFITPIFVTILLYINFNSLLYIFLIVFSSMLMLIVFYFYIEKILMYQEEFYVLILSSIIGAIILTEANHIITVLIGTELMSLPIFGLMTYFLESKRKIRVILKYMFLSSLMTSFALLGIVLIYLKCGSLTLNCIKITLLISSSYENKILLIGLMLLFISFFFKLSLFPLHFWIFDIYENISPVLLLYSTIIIKIASFSALIKILSYCPYEKCKIIYLIIETISFFSIIYGSIVVITQNNIKKFFGYSSIVHMGYALISVLTINNYYLSNHIAFIYLLNYVISSIGIFSLLSLLVLLNNNITFDINHMPLYNMLLIDKPVLSFSFVVIIFSFLGIPFTFGFFAKYFTLIVILHKKLWLILCAVIINSGCSIYYYLKIILIAYNKTNVALINGKKCYKIIDIIIILISSVIILFGIFPQILMNFLNMKYL